MAAWIVKAVWREDEAEVAEEWQVEAATAREAIAKASTHIRFPPYHPEARLRTEVPDPSTDAARGNDDVKRISASV
ncbi:MAG: hypothetical protein SFW09_06785 [Hyphomicrobiaceae bacterium]|nr:hypothetical protein [Hyphomicrobiaceae bacterium]